MGQTGSAYVPPAVDLMCWKPLLICHPLCARRAQTAPGDGAELEL